MTSVSLFLISYLERFRQFEKSLQPPALADYEVTQMRRKSCYEMQSIESLGKNLVKGKKG